jgi:hypothetical protein
MHARMGAVCMPIPSGDVMQSGELQPVPRQKPQTPMTT